MRGATRQPVPWPMMTDARLSALERRERTAALSHDAAPIVACPACATRFQVIAAALGGGAGRRLRCANCGHLWHHRAEPTLAGGPASAAPAAVAAATFGPPQAADRPAPAPLAPDATRWQSASETIAMEALGLAGVGDAPRPRLVPPLTVPAPVLRADAPTVLRLDAEPAHSGPDAAGRRLAGRRCRLLAGSLGLAALTAAIVLVAVLARDHIATIWPAAERAPAVAAIAPPAGAGLKVTLSPRRTSDSVVISGDIVNNATVARRIPRLRVTLRDRHETALASKVIDPPVLSLPPGASAHFNAVFEHPDGAATGVAVSFATD
jgi:predicted Zn finger-like uncharacterized protein